MRIFIDIFFKKTNNFFIFYFIPFYVINALLGFSSKFCIWIFYNKYFIFIYTFIFSNIAKIPIEGSSPTLFYLSGIIMWNYFADCFNQTSDTFSQNANIFGKVYFPRLIIPISKILSGLVKYFIQFLLFLAIYLYVFITNENNNLSPNYYVFLFPFLQPIQYSIFQFQLHLQSICIQDV